MGLYRTANMLIATVAISVRRIPSWSITCRLAYHMLTNGARACPSKMLKIQSHSIEIAMRTLLAKCIGLTSCLVCCVAVLSGNARPRASRRRFDNPDIADETVVFLINL